MPLTQKPNDIRLYFMENEPDRLKAELDKLPDTIGVSLTDSIYIVANNFLEAHPNYLCVGDKEKDWLKWNGVFWEQKTRGNIEVDVMGFVKNNPKLRHPRQVTHIVSCIKMLVQETKQLYRLLQKTRSDNICKLS